MHARAAEEQVAAFLHLIFLEPGDAQREQAQAQQCQSYALPHGLAHGGSREGDTRLTKGCRPQVGGTSHSATHTDITHE